MTKILLFLGTDTELTEYKATLRDADILPAVHTIDKININEDPIEILNEIKVLKGIMGETKFVYIVKLDHTDKGVDYLLTELAILGGTTDYSISIQKPKNSRVTESKQLNKLIEYLNFIKPVLVLEHSFVSFVLSTFEELSDRLEIMELTKMFRKFTDTVPNFRILKNTEEFLELGLALVRSVTCTHRVDVDNDIASEIADYILTLLHYANNSKIEDKIFNNVTENMLWGISAKVYEDWNTLQELDLSEILMTWYNNYEHRSLIFELMEKKLNKQVRILNSSVR